MQPTRHSLSRYFACVLLLGTLLVSAACQKAETPLETLPRGETGRVVRIIDGDALVLDTGLTVRLVGIEAPSPKRRNRTGQPYADKATRLLEDLSMGRQVRLYYPGITRDRYDRALAYVRTDDRLGDGIWLNHEMVARGAARTRLYPDTARHGELLLDLEAVARTARRGLWALSDYEVRPAREVPADARGFMIVTATPMIQSPPRDERALCTRTLQNTDMILTVQPGARFLCEASATDRPFRFRGYVRDGTIEIAHALNAEPLDTLQASAP